MKIFAATTNALALLAVLPAMVHARGASSARQERGEKQRHHKSRQAVEAQIRSEANMEKIRTHSAVRRRERRLKSSKDKSSKSSKKVKTEVLIGGVGYAGAKLGEILAEADVDFMMVEASDRIGGRMYNVPFGAGDTKYSIEVGAQWIDGIDGSPNWDLAVESGLGGAFDEFGFEVYDENGNRDFFNEFFEEGSECLAVDTANTICDSVAFGCFQVNQTGVIEDQALCDLVAADGNFVPANEDDLPLSDTYDLAGDFRVSDRESPTSARVCQVFYEDFEQGLTPIEISTNNSAPLKAYVDFGDGDYFINDLRGFAWLPRYLTAKYLSTSVNTPEEITFDDERLKMQHKIIKVHWDPKGKKKVHVDVCMTKRVDDIPGQPVLFPCKKGSKHRFRIKADDFVSTFPASVLRESIKLEIEGVSFKDSEDIAPRFVPALTKAIEGVDVLLGYRTGNYGKAFFQFPQKFWSDAAYMLSAASGNGYEGDFAPTWSNRAVDYLDPDSNILWLYTFGQRAYDLDAMSEEDAIDELLPVLNDMFTVKITELYGRPLIKDDVQDFYLSRWSQDPLFWGAFDVNHINVPNSAREIFRKRYGNLMFSGGYSCDRHNGWTHGAQLAGERSGIFLLKERYGFDDLDTNNICDDGTALGNTPDSETPDFVD